jgi:hypothetical protein
LKRFLILFIPLALMLVGLPLLGLTVADKALAPYLEFPPQTARVVHAPFSWWAFAAIALMTTAAVTPIVMRVVRCAGRYQQRAMRSARLPWWGWLGGAFLVLAWWLAWNRFAWFAPLQTFTFSPIWLGYIVLVNALTMKRTGRCMLRDRTGYFLALFPLSAAFWWFFEYLNRFVQNWYYVGASTDDPWQYFWQATLPFATVLPAVLGTREWLTSFPRLSCGLEYARPAPMLRSRWTASIALLVAAFALGAIGTWPDRLFSLLWLAPLLLITALQVLLRQKSIVDSPARGDWRGLWQAALAGLVCGVFWELWNYKSLTHWEYSVPFVHAFEIFHMPFLGYAGYLPFGLECLAVAKLLDPVFEDKDKP